MNWYDPIIFAGMMVIVCANLVLPAIQIEIYGRFASKIDKNESLSFESSQEGIYNCSTADPYFDYR